MKTRYTREQQVVHLARFEKDTVCFTGPFLETRCEDEASRVRVKTEISNDPLCARTHLGLTRLEDAVGFINRLPTAWPIRPRANRLCTVLGGDRALLQHGRQTRSVRASEVCLYERRGVALSVCPGIAKRGILGI